MSPQRVADAAQVSPYTFVPQQPQASSSAPEGSAQDRRGKGKKIKSRPRTERSSRPDEERFNIGPPSPRTLANAGRGGARRSHRGGRQGTYDDVPNYPPPSFQEAISTPPMSVCSSTTTLVQVVPPTPIMASENAMQSSGRQPAAAGTSQRLITHPENVETGSDSDGSLEIIDDFPPSGDQLEQRVKDDWRHRRGVEFPIPPSSQPEYSNLKTTFPRMGVANRTPPVALENEIAEKSEVQLYPNHPSSPKRRLMSLSPLRTLFPIRPHDASDRSLSAHPSPNTSPYGPSHSTAFFRSTTSLASSSLLKFPFTTGSITGRGDSFMARKLFSHKGKEKEKLDSWEILSQECPENSELPVSRIPEPPTSLMSAMASIANASVTSVGTSPTRCQSFTYGSPTVETFRAASPSITHPDSPSDTRSHDDSFLSTHPLSVRDLKVVPMPFVKRPVRQRSPAPLSPTSSITSVETAGTVGPPLTSVRTRMNPKNPVTHAMLKQTAPVARASSPLSIDSWRAESNDESVLFQQALETPLPLTPIHRSHFDYSREGAMTSVIAPIPARPRRDVFSGDSIPLLHSITSEISIIKTQNPSFDEPMTPTSRRHYPGRPLPRPPGNTRIPIDSIYATNDELGEGMVRSDTHCPEGLLIDLDDTSLMTGSSTSGTSTPHIEEGRVRPVVLPGSTSSFPTDLIDLSPETPRPQSASPGPSYSSLTSFSDLTELDHLASNLTDNQHDGTDYENLLLISEFLGPASPPPRSGASLQTTSVRNGSANGNTSLLGRIELQRRRITVDGRVKLKLSLFDVAVDRCGICLSQFRSGELASFSSVCHHSFHDNCLAQWLARSKTCPMCRVALDAVGR